MIVLGIDPGLTTGYVAYDTDTRTVLARGQFRGHDSIVFIPKGIVTSIACIERLVPHGASYPQVVQSNYIAGRLAERTEAVVPTHEMTRVEVRRQLQVALHGAIKVVDDKTVWAALKELHGGPDSDKKGGPLLGVKAHERAALAVAVAWALREGVTC